MTPFREPDRSALATFAQHVSIAETLLGVIADLTAQVGIEADGNDTQRARGEAWSSLWEQLGQARAIAARLARDVTAFNAARVRAGDPYVVAAQLAPIPPAMRSAAVDAIAALRAAIPEVVVPSPPQPAEGATPTSPGSTWGWRPGAIFWFRIGILVALLLAALLR
jgi:hypothetical protein